MRALGIWVCLVCTLLQAALLCERFESPDTSTPQNAVLAGLDCSCMLVGGFDHAGLVRRAAEGICGNGYWRLGERSMEGAIRPLEPRETSEARWHQRMAKDTMRRPEEGSA